jgi:hypothetical protein
LMHFSTTTPPLMVVQESSKAEAINRIAPGQIFMRRESRPFTSAVKSRKGHTLE